MLFLLNRYDQCNDFWLRLVITVCWFVTNLIFSFSRLIGWSFTNTFLLTQLKLQLKEKWLYCHCLIWWNLRNLSRRLHQSKLTSFSDVTQHIFLDCLARNDSNNCITFNLAAKNDNIIRDNKRDKVPIHAHSFSCLFLEFCFFMFTGQ